MTDALVQINDRLAKAARARGFANATFYCECGECLAEDVPLTLEEHDAIRDREDLIFAPGHDAPRRYWKPSLVTPAPALADPDWTLLDSGQWRAVLLQGLLRAMPRDRESRTLR
jgi:hypothetical protein